MPLRPQRLVKSRWFHLVWICLTLWALDEWLKPHLIPLRFGTVVDGALYRSGQMPERLVGQLVDEYQLKTIVALNVRAAAAEKEYVEPLGVKHHALKLRGDGTGDPDAYIQTLTLMKAAVDTRQPLLVHCAAGSQRTGAAVAMYRMLFQGWQADQILEELEEYDWKPEKNWVLIDYINEHLPDIQAQLLKNSILAQKINLPLIHKTAG